jgi:hypothetical protein
MAKERVNTNSDRLGILTYGRQGGKVDTFDSSPGFVVLGASGGQNEIRFRLSTTTFTNKCRFLTTKVPICFRCVILWVLCYQFLNILTYSLDLILCFSRLSSKYYVFLLRSGIL